jgi:hypothetical protein
MAALVGAHLRRAIVVALGENGRTSAAVSSS